MLKKLGAAAAALALTLGLAFAAGPNYVTHVQWQKFLGKVLFTNTVEFQGATSITGSIEDLTLTDDLTVGDDLTVTDDTVLSSDLAVTGNITSVGGVTSPLTLGAATARIYHGTDAVTKAGGAEAIFTITNATLQGSGGTVFYTLRIGDGTDSATRTGLFQVVCNNLAGTTTANAFPLTHATESTVETTNAKTVEYALTDTSAANVCNFLINIDSDMAGTVTGTFYWTMILNGPGTVS